MGSFASVTTYSLFILNKAPYISEMLTGYVATSRYENFPISHKSDHKYAVSLHFHKHQATHIEAGILHHAFPYSAVSRYTIRGIQMSYVKSCRITRNCTLLNRPCNGGNQSMNTSEFRTARKFI